MSKKTNSKLATGVIVGYSTLPNPFSGKFKVLIRAGGQTFTVPVDNQQLKFIQTEYQYGHQVAVSFENGDWQIGSKPLASSPYLSEENIEKKELFSLVSGEVTKNIVENNVPEPVVEAEPEDSDQVYIQHVEQNFKGEANKMLCGMGLAHLIVMH